MERVRDREIREIWREMKRDEEREECITMFITGDLGVSMECVSQ